MLEQISRGKFAARIRLTHAKCVKSCRGVCGQSHCAHYPSPSSESSFVVLLPESSSPESSPPASLLLSDSSVAPASMDGVIDVSIVPPELSGTPSAGAGAALSGASRIIKGTNNMICKNFDRLESGGGPAGGSSPPGPDPESSSPLTLFLSTTCG